MNPPAVFNHRRLCCQKTSNMPFKKCLWRPPKRFFKEKIHENDRKEILGKAAKFQVVISTSEGTAQENPQGGADSPPPPPDRNRVNCVVGNALADHARASPLPCVVGNAPAGSARASPLPCVAGNAPASSARASPLPCVAGNAPAGLARASPLPCVAGNALADRARAFPPPCVAWNALARVQCCLPPCATEMPLAAVRGFVPGSSLSLSALVDLSPASLCSC